MEGLSAAGVSLKAWMELEDLLQGDWLTGITTYCFQFIVGFFVVFFFATYT